MSTFTVARSDGLTTTYAGKYNLSDGGVLSVMPYDGKPVVFSPSGWATLEIDED